MKPKPHKKRNKTQFLQTPTESESSAADFAFKITKIAVSQICQSVGFNATQLSALETLTHIATLYLQTIAKAAVSFSNASNRTQSNIFDIINSLHDMSAVQGFVGGSTLHCNSSGISLLSSSVLKDVKFYVNFSDEIPFAKPIPRRNSIPLVRNSIQMELESRGLHIPNWLPRFPDESTYKKKCGEVECCKRKGGELELWEYSKVVGGIGNANELQEVSEENERINCGTGGELAMERIRVRFKIGGMVNAQKKRKVNSCS